MNRVDNLSAAWLADPGRPICCDTSALYHPSPLRQLRRRFPDRHIMLPVIAYFERQRQLRVCFGIEYRPDVLLQNLLDPLEIDLVLCEAPVAVLLAEMVEQIETRALSALVGETDLTQHSRRVLVQRYSSDLRDQQANWRPVLRGEQALPAPCGQRCRLGDYIIAATARYYDALLLTNDSALLCGFDRYLDLFPPALSPDEVDALNLSIR